MTRLETFQERMTPEELKLYRTLPHELSKADFDRRAALIKRETAIDYQWGFFDHGLIPWLKRKWYMIFVHRKLVRSTQG